MASMPVYWLHFSVSDSVYEAGLLKAGQTRQPDQLVLGPFSDELGLTYQYIRVGEMGDRIAAWDSQFGVWRIGLDPEIRGLLDALDGRIDPDGMIFTDVWVTTSPPDATPRTPASRLSLVAPEAPRSRMLAVSTAHLTPASLASLTRVAADIPAHPVGRWPSLLAFGDAYIVNVPSRLDELTVPEDLCLVLERAQRLSVSWVLLTPTSPKLDELPTYPQN